jgi:hypothetical protein
VRFAFRVNKVEVTVALRAGEGNRLELLAVDPVVGEFALREDDQIEARDIKLVAALNVHLHGGGWKKITVVQALSMLVGLNRPVCHSVQNVPISNA